MTLPRSVAEVLSEHVVFEVERVDRMHLDVYVPQLRHPAALVGFIGQHLGGPRATPGRFRTRVITDGVAPSLHVDYKNAKIKQCHQLGRRCAPRPPSTTPATSASANG
jgi:hypothetical protein